MTHEIHHSEFTTRNLFEFRGELTKFWVSLKIVCVFGCIYLNVVVARCLTTFFLVQRMNLVAPFCHIMWQLDWHFICDIFVEPKFAKPWTWHSARYKSNLEPNEKGENSREPMSMQYACVQSLRFMFHIDLSCLVSFVCQTRQIVDIFTWNKPVFWHGMIKIRGITFIAHWALPKFWKLRTVESIQNHPIFTEETMIRYSCYRILSRLTFMRNLTCWKCAWVEMNRRIQWICFGNNRFSGGWSLNLTDIQSHK